MSRRSHRELWEQLKVILLFSRKKRYTSAELYNIMSDMELAQLAQDPLSILLKPLGGKKKE